jgi:hypothetical protein
MREEVDITPINRLYLYYFKQCDTLHQLQKELYDAEKNDR